MKMERKRRRDIDRTIADNKQKVNTRLKETQVITKDKKTEADTAQKLRQSGTVEGAEAVKRAVSDAAKATDAEFQRKERDFQQKTITELQRMENELGQRSQATAQDIQQIGQAAGQIETAEARSRIKGAESGARDDKQFLDQSKNRETADRKDGQQRMNEQSRQIKATRISFPD